MITDLDRIGLKLANDERQWSPDPSTQIGVCLILADDRTVLSCNHFPDGIAPRLERPEKYTYIEHAERNAIYRAARLGFETYAATLYMVGMGPPSGPCDKCARAIIQAGIKRVVCAPYKPVTEHWIEGVGVGTEMLIEAGIEYVEVPPEEFRP